MSIVLDTFTAADGTEVTNRTSDSGHNWIRHVADPGRMFISANRARIAATGGALYLDAAMPGPDYEVRADYHYLTLSGAPAICGRMDTTDLTGYGLRHHPTNGWEIIKLVKGAETALDAAAATLTDNTTYAIRFVLRGPSLKGYVNGTLVVEATDIDITDAGVVGVYDLSPVGATIGKHLDMIEAVIPPRPSRVLVPGSTYNLGPLTPH